MDHFELVSEYQPMGDQPAAIAKLAEGVRQGKRTQVLLGGTGTGKTFTFANVIKEINKPTLVLSHNKTLAAQLYSELKEFFPHNAVEYFISYFDFYQPEAYIPKSDTYIDKEAVRNDDIERMRISTVNSLLSRRDTIVVASVASIYGAGNPQTYAGMIFKIKVGEEISRRSFLLKLTDRQYTNGMDLAPGTFRVRGDVVDIMGGGMEDLAVRVEFFGDEIDRISQIDPLTGKTVSTHQELTIFPATDYVSDEDNIRRACHDIEEELEDRLKYFENEGKPLEYERLEQRTRQDVEMLSETGMCAGIENYARHLDGRGAGERPYCLFDYFPEDFLLIVDESHVMLPQIRAMYNGDHSRKQTLVDYGFRLPSALDNRPLQFEEYEELRPQTIYVSATPGDYELEETGGEVAEQIIRPTGLLDPIIDVRPIKNQMDDIIDEINACTERDERVLITTLTKRMAEDLTDYLKDFGIKVAYMHSDIKTLERSEILRDLRLGKYDVLVGINLLREGLDLPEVSRVCILDADKEGFLRSRRSLIQTAGRAARNANGKVIMYADVITESMRECIDETNRRRAIQSAYNEEHGIVPKTIRKNIAESLSGEDETAAKISDYAKKKRGGKRVSKKQTDNLIESLTKEMLEAAKRLDFERAMELRDMIQEIKDES